MPTKVIAVGDPHFKTDNVPEVNMFVERLEKLAKEQNPDLIVILGDVLHTHERLHVTPLNLAIDFVQRMSAIAETIVMVGNHDLCNNSQFLTTNHWMNCLKYMPNVSVVDTILHKIILDEDDSDNDLHFVFCPYVPPGRFQEALDTSEEDWKNADCIFAHQEFYGCKMGAIVSVEGDKWSEDFPYVVSGHIHSKQTIQKNIYYCGSSMQNAFGESEENIIPILSWERHGEPYKLEEIDLELPRKRIVYTDVENIEDLKLPETEDKVRVTISGVYDDFKAFKKTKKYRELIKKGTKVVFKAKKIQVNDTEDTTETEETDFSKILSVLVNTEKNPFLYELYELILNNKEISAEDVLFL